MAWRVHPDALRVAANRFAFPSRHEVSALGGTAVEHLSTTQAMARVRERAPWNGRWVGSGELAQRYGSADADRSLAGRVAVPRRVGRPTRGNDEAFR